MIIWLIHWLSNLAEEGILTDPFSLALYSLTERGLFR